MLAGARPEPHDVHDVPDMPDMPELAQEAADFRLHQQRIQRRATVLVATIHDALYGVGRQTRRWLAAVDRTCRSGTGPLPDPSDPVAEEIGIQAPRLAAKLAVDAADRAALVERWSRFTAHYRNELKRDRARDRDAEDHAPRPAQADPEAGSRQWTIDGARVAELRSLDGPARYVAWRAIADDLAVARHVAVDGGAGVVDTESPVAVDALFDGPADAATRLVLIDLATTGACPA